LTDANRVFTWPSVQKALLSVGDESADGLRHVLEEGTAWFIEQELETHPYPLPHTAGLKEFAMSGSDILSGQRRVKFPELTSTMIKHYTDLYFNTFNMVYPILDYDVFVNELMPIISEQGFGDGCVLSVITLLVLALGRTALEGTFGDPISSESASASGMRGGSADIPPALDIFNEARRRFGFVHTQCSLENAQILLLAACVNPRANFEDDC